MNHLDDVQLQGYLDGELKPRVTQRVEHHLDRCVECRARLDAWAALSESIQETRMSTDSLEPYGQFWVKLANQLPTEGRSTVWPYAPLFPPILLVVLGVAAKVILTLGMTAFALSQLGVIPSLAGMVGWIGTSLGWFPRLEQLVMSWITPLWGGLSVTSQRTAVIVLSTSAFVVVTFVIATLYATWALCWKAADRPTRNGGHS